jgi:hypothetical protein
MAAVVHPAKIQDRDGGLLAPSAMLGLDPLLTRTVAEDDAKLGTPEFFRKSVRCGLAHIALGGGPVGFRSSITDSRRQKTPDPA